MNVLLFTTRAVNGWESGSLLPHFSLLNGKNVDLLTMNKTKSSQNKIGEFGLRISNTINPYNLFYDLNKNVCDTWEEIYKAIDVYNLQFYDAFYIIGNLDLWRSNLTRKSNRVGKFPKDSGQLKFISTGKHLVGLLAILKAHHRYKIPIHELVLDPNEITMDLYHPDYVPDKNFHFIYHGYDIPEYNIQRVDSLQYHYGIQSRFDFLDKEIDFVFGYNVLQNSGREKYVDELEDFRRNFDTSAIYVKNYQNGDDYTISKEKYLGLIERSKYTYMLPAYDKNCFSIYRFIESINLNCLPLIHPDCKVEDVEKSFDIELSDLKNFKITESNRLEKIEYLKEKMLTFERDFNTIFKNDKSN